MTPNVKAAIQKSGVDDTSLYLVDPNEGIQRSFYGIYTIPEIEYCLEQMKKLETFLKHNLPLGE